MPIQILSDVVAAQIAAGEVVERPASVIKELVENSLDAGARTIRVEVEQGGRRLLRVTDDGSGIPSYEAALAFARHATSKLAVIDDLDSIQTLGFRGEALASIASVAQVTMLTRTRAENAGTLLRIEGGTLADQRSAGSPIGTTITVENLFYNTPARLKFMKADATERRHIDSVVTRYAIAYPNVRFTLSQDGRVTFATTGSGSLSDVLVEALGLDIMREMLEVSPLAPAPSRPDLPPISVHGYTSTPQLSRNNRSHIMLFVNGRHIQDSSLSYAVGQAYHTLLPAERSPVSVLLITMPPGDVDVNVHPTKAEVRFRSPDAVFSAVQRAVRRAVINQTPIPTSGVLPGTNGIADYEPRPWRDLSPTLRSAPSAVPPSARPAPAEQLDIDLPIQDAGRYTQQIPPREVGEAQTQPSSAHPAAPPEEPEIREERPRTLPPLRVVGQLAGMYILAEGPAGLYLVDQHAAHERILYEQFMRERARQRPVAQHTLEPVAVQLTPDAMRLIEENADALRAVGFDIEPFGGKMIRISAVPALLADRDVDEAVRAVLDDLESGAEPTEPAAEARLVLRVCKAAAVKAGQILSYTEMNTLLRHLERCESPRTCPHGRPTMIHISAAQLAKEFGRT